MNSLKIALSNKIARLLIQQLLFLIDWGLFGCIGRNISSHPYFKDRETEETISMYKNFIWRYFPGRSRHIVDTSTVSTYPGDQQWINIQENWDGYSSVQFSHSVVSDSLHPMNSSTPGFPVHHQLPEFTQTHVHWVSDAILPCHPMSSPSPPTPNPSQHHSLFQ